ncbi:MAG: S8 family serine peptidase [Bacteroidota bacterium]
MSKIYLFIFFLFSTTVSWGQSSLQDAAYVPDEVIIRLKASATRQMNLGVASGAPSILGVARVDTVSRKLGALKADRLFRQGFKNLRKAQELHLDRYFTIKLPAGSNIDEVMAKYLALDEVELVELNYIGKLQTVPNDPLYGEQWGLNNTGNAQEHGTTNLVGTPGADINAEAAWDIHTGTSNVTIAIIDSGVDYNHPEFSGRIVPGYDFVDDDSDPFDENNLAAHGTKCAGVAAAAGNNGIGVAGVTWGALIMPIRVADEFNNTLVNDLAQGILFAVDSGAHVISISIGFDQGTSSLANAINYAQQLDVLVFASRGNDDDTVDVYPSYYSNVISVGGLSPCDTRKTPTSCDGVNSWGSSYGGGQDKMDFVAPSVNIMTTDIMGTDGTGGDYDFFGGTSAACPIAAGVGALIRSYNSSLTADEIRTIMRETSVDIGIPGYDDETGYGRIDAHAALVAASPEPVEVELISSSFDTGYEGFTTVGENAGWGISTDLMSTAPYLFMSKEPIVNSPPTITSPSFNASPYEQILLTFNVMFYLSSDPTNTIHINYYDGSSWINLGDLLVASGYRNNVIYSKSIIINSSEYNMASNAQIRFEIVGNGRYSTLIDNVVITGSTSLGTGTSRLADGSSLPTFDTVIEELVEKQVSIYPNPTTDVATIDHLPSGAKVRLLDISGRVLLQTTDSTIDMSGKRSGLYFIEIVSLGGESKKLKLIKR